MKVTDIRTYRARTVQEALALVRRDLGPGASVLAHPRGPRRRPAAMVRRTATDRGRGIDRGVRAQSACAASRRHRRRGHAA